MLVVLVADVATSAWILVPFGKAKVDDVDDVLLRAGAYQEVVWLNVTVQKSTLVNELDALEHLDGEHEDGL